MIFIFPREEQEMDSQAKKKALFRAKLNAQKKEKRIDSPLVRLVIFILLFYYLANGIFT